MYLYFRCVHLSKTDYFCRQLRASFCSPGDHRMEDVNIRSEEFCPYLHWYMDQKTIYSFIIMTGRQPAQMGTSVLQVAVYRWYCFYSWILVETSMLLIQDFTLFRGNYKMWPPSNVILILMELTTFTKGGSYCKGSASWVPLLVMSQGDQNQNESRDQFTSSHPDDISGFTKWEWCLHLISPCATSVPVEHFQVSSPLCLKVDLQENP